jgi:hypothetical protein
MGRRPSWAAPPLHHAPAFRAAAGAAILHEGLDLLLLLRREHTPGGEHGFHALLFHLSLQGVHLIEFLHDRVVIRIIRPHQFTEFNVVQFQIRTRLYGSLLGLHADLVQASNLLVGETKILAHPGILRHAQKARASTESAPAAALPTHPVAFCKPLRPVTPLVLASTTKLMLALAGVGPLRGAFLSPTDKRHRQQNQKT